MGARQASIRHPYVRVQSSVLALQRFAQLAMQDTSRSLGGARLDFGGVFRRILFVRDAANCFKLQRDSGDTNLHGEVL